MDIGERLRALRELRGLSQGDIERRSGLLRSYISRVEGGHTSPSLRTLQKLAKALGVEPYQLLFSNRHGQPRPAAAPPGHALSKSATRLVRLHENMSTGNRKLLLTIASKLAKD